MEERASITEEQELRHVSSIRKFRNSEQCTNEQRWPKGVYLGGVYRVRRVRECEARRARSETTADSAEYPAS